jgi:hypothetical protein
MKYETPKVIALTPAVNAIQHPSGKPGATSQDGIDKEEVSAYADWED